MKGNENYMTYSKIKKLESYLRISPLFLTKSDIDSIVKAVSKGIKQPLLEKRKIGKFHTLYVCPNCKNTKYVTRTGNAKPLRCSHCGQRLDWKTFIDRERYENKIVDEYSKESD